MLKTVHKIKYKINKRLKVQCAVSLIGIKLHWLWNNLQYKDHHVLVYFPKRRVLSCFITLLLNSVIQSSSHTTSPNMTLSYWCFQRLLHDEIDFLLIIWALHEQRRDHVTCWRSLMQSFRDWSTAQTKPWTSSSCSIVFQNPWGGRVVVFLLAGCTGIGGRLYVIPFASRHSLSLRLFKTCSK